MALETSNHPTGVETAAPGRRGLLVVLATISLTVIAAMLVQPRVSRWLNIREAYRNLSHPDENERVDAVHRLVGEGENPDEALIALLNDPDEGVRLSAAHALAGRRPVTDRAIEVFLAGLESESPGEAVVRWAPSLFYRHAELAAGPITPTEQRMIASLGRRLHGPNAEAVALSTFLHRDPTLIIPLKDYLKAAEIYDQLFVTRQMAKFNPAFQDDYLKVLLNAASQSVNIHAQRQAMYDLEKLQRDSGSLLAELEARREKTADPQEVSRLDRAIVLLRTKK
jgi:hypothetical protein